jgi:hypothetical protein
MAFLSKPYLGNPSLGWKYDLPGPNDPPARTPYPAVMPNPPNYSNNIYMELPRATLRARGMVFIFGLIFLPLSLYIPYEWIILIFSTGKIPASLLTFGMIISFVAPAWIGVYFCRIDLTPPLDEPIRFNRARRKIYVYRFHCSALKPWSRTAWGVRPAVYDWDHVHAEFCSVYAPMGHGGLVENVSLAILEPGTNRVVDRFLFAHGGQEAEMYWAMAQLFMQQGPHALPKFDRPPRDWNNEQHIFNLARRFAPKVKWPEAMDIESRTAP